MDIIFAYHNEVLFSYTGYLDFIVRHCMLVSNVAAAKEKKTPLNHAQFGYMCNYLQKQKIFFSKFAIYIETSSTIENIT